MARLGFVGAGGAAGMTDALKEIVAQRLLEKKLEEQRLQQEFENRMATRQADTGDSRFARTQGHTETMDTAGLGLRTRGVDLDERGLEHRIGQDVRGNTIEDKALADAAQKELGRVTFLRRRGQETGSPAFEGLEFGLNPDVTLTGKERGKDVGEEGLAAWQSGGSTVNQGRVSQQTAGNIASSNAAAQNAINRRVVTPPRQSAALTEKVAKLEQSMGMLDDMEATLNESWLGPIQGRVTEASINMPGVEVPDDLAQFAAQTAAMKNATIQAITGAAMGEAEAKRIMAQIPSFTDKPNVWRQKAASTRKNLELIADKMTQGQAAQGNAANPDATTKATKPLSAAELLKKYGGG